jgi:hypothetical protein
LGEILHDKRPAVAKIEKRTDMYVSTLRRFVEAMGGELEITARFPDYNVRIKNFSDLGVSRGASKALILKRDVVLFCGPLLPVRRHSQE